MPISKRTWTVVAERPLDPQPPYSARPHWCYINTLIFYDKDVKEVWRQDIPEADSVRVRKNPDGTYACDKLGINVSVRRTRRWGWLLHIEYTHELARKAWPFDNLTYKLPHCPYPQLKGVS